MIACTPSAIGLLTRQYRSVLKKCFLINMGLFAVSGQVCAATTVSTYDELLGALSDANADVVLNMSGAGIDLDGGNGFSVGTNQTVGLENIGTTGVSSWTHTSHNIINSGTLSIDGVIFKQNETISSTDQFVGGVIRNSGHILKLVDTVFDSNRTETPTSQLWGGIVYNYPGTIDLIQNVTFKNNYAYAGQYAPHGGVFYNEGHIGIMDNVTFEDNTMTGATDMRGGAHGTALDNNQLGTIDKITNSVFRNNYMYRTGTAVVSGNYHASGGALDNFNYIGEISNTLFEGNHISTESPSAPSQGGAIYHIRDSVGQGKIDKIENVQFINNYSYAKKTFSAGGALAMGTVSGISEKASIGSLENVLFQGNYVQSDGSYVLGGAIYNGNSTIETIDGIFKSNYAYSTGGSAEGGIIDNHGTIGSMVGTFEGNYAYSTSGAAYGGAIDNNGTIEIIDGIFKNNYAQSTASYALGGVIDNYNTINSLNGTFEGNYTYSGASYTRGGVLYTYKEAMQSIDGIFKNNYTKSATSTASGGAIYVIGEETHPISINTISGQFLSNYAEAAQNANGGALNINLNSLIPEAINAYFEGNYTQSTGASSKGGALANWGYIKSLQGDFKNNHTTSAGIGAIGGAVVNSFFSSAINPGIDELSGNYSGNYAEATGTGYAQGGAIHNGSNTNLNLIANSIFIANYVKSGTNASTSGGAIWNEGAITFGGVNTFTGNYKEINGVKSYNDVYNSGTITLADNSKTTFNGSVEGSDGTLNLGKNAQLNLNSAMSQQKVNFTDVATVNLGSYEPEDSDKTYGTLDLISLTGGNGTVTLNAMNDEFQSLKFGDTTLGSTLDYQLDVDALAEKTDTIEAKALTAGTVNISDIRFKDNFEDATGVIQVLKNKDTSTLLILTLDPQFVHDYGEGVVVETIGADDLTSGDIVWNGNYGTYTLTTTTTATFDVTTTDTEDDSIGYVAHITKVKTSNTQENLSMINQNEDYVQKSFSFETADDIYESGADIGKTYGSLTIKGVSNEGNKSTIDMNGYSGFEVDDTAELTIKNSRIVGETAVVSSGKVTLDNSTVENIENNGKLEVRNGSDFASINGTGETELNGDLNLSGKTIRGNTVNAKAGTIALGENSIDRTVVLNAEEGATIDVEGNQISAKEAVFKAGSTLSLFVNSKDNYGSVTADKITVDKGAVLNATLGQGIVGIGERVTLQLLSADNTDFNNFEDEFDNNMYRFEKEGKNGAYSIRLVRTAEDVSAEAGGTRSNQEVASAWVDGPAFEGGSAIADGLTSLAQNDAKAFNQALTAIAPNDAPVTQGVNAQIHDILLKRITYQFRHGGSLQGMASGDIVEGVSLWAEGYGGKSKLQRRGNYYGFSATSKGVIIGADKKIGSSIKVGGGMQYDKTDIDGYQRDTDVDTKMVFAYGEYAPNKLHIRGLLSYGMSDYHEKKRVLGKKYKGQYSADTYSAQVISGYDVGYITPISGLKYYHIKRHGYVDGLGQSVSGKNMDILTAVGGVQIANEYEMPCGHILKPEAYIGVNYDLISDRDSAIVSIANGTSYKVHGKSMARFGIETQMGLTIELSDRLSANINYIGGFRKDFQDHTGLMGLKYNF